MSATLLYQPQQALALESIDKLPNGGDYIIEPKFDGWRILTEVWHECGRGGVTFFTRTGETIDGDRFPQIQRDLLNLFPVDTWLDGEIVAMTTADNGHVVCDWATVQTFAGSKTRVDEEGVCTYSIFDVLAFENHDARFAPMKTRRELLDKVMKKGDAVYSHVSIPPQLDATTAMHDRLVELGWEGSIVKDRFAPYASGKRGKGWWKLKANWTADAIIMDFQDGKAGWTGMVGAVIFGQFDNRCPDCGELADLTKSHADEGHLIVHCNASDCSRSIGFDAHLTKRGKCSGFSMKIREAMTADPDGYKGRIIEVRHNGEQASGSLRHPQFITFREDKNLEDILWLAK